MKKQHILIFLGLLLLAYLQISFIKTTLDFRLWPEDVRSFFAVISVYLSVCFTLIIGFLKK